MRDFSQSFFFHPTLCFGTVSAVQGRWWLRREVDQILALQEGSDPSHHQSPETPACPTPQPSRRKTCNVKFASLTSIMKVGFGHHSAIKKEMDKRQNMYTYFGGRMFDYGEF